jgi:hypothetical protein
MRSTINKLGHHAPHKYVSNKFNSIEIDGDFAYCASHNFVYNTEVEKIKLYEGLACYYTDKRVVDGRHNYYSNTMIHWTRWKSISLKACIRKTLSCGNIPKGTRVSFNKSYYHPKTKVDNSYSFKIMNKNVIDFEYEINDPGYFNNFKGCEFSKKLTDELRSNGFIVNVDNGNANFLSSMVSHASSYIGKTSEVDEEEGETAVAYGFGKKIGFSSKNNTLYGYSNACNNILWDNFGEFNKWSQCNEIHKTMVIEEIIKILKTR